MNVIMITPAPPKSRAGNRATAVRWAHILRDLGHEVEISVNYGGAPFDLMIALHAWRSAGAIAEFHTRYPAHPLIVALTGTDLYRFIHTHPEPTVHSIERADRLVVLHGLAHEALPQSVHGKVHVIYQSALPLPRAYPQSRRSFDVCVVGHLRHEKDSLRTAIAVRDLPATSRIRVLHYGKAHTSTWAEMARKEMERNPRYRWFGEVPHWKVRRAYGSCRLMVLSSRMEGGANVISEAVVAGLPVVASEIPGSVGLLGRNYPGYYPVEDTGKLRETLLRAETEQGFLPSLASCCNQHRSLFTPEREAQGWKALLENL